MKNDPERERIAGRTTLKEAIKFKKNGGDFAKFITGPEKLVAQNFARSLPGHYRSILGSINGILNNTNLLGDYMKPEKTSLRTFMVACRHWDTSARGADPERADELLRYGAMHLVSGLIQQCATGNFEATISRDLPRDQAIRVWAQNLRADVDFGMPRLIRAYQALFPSVAS